MLIQMCIDSEGEWHKVRTVNDVNFDAPVSR